VTAARAKVAKIYADAPAEPALNSGVGRKEMVVGDVARRPAILNVAVSEEQSSIARAVAGVHW
jgi:hypothetical protein